jgi:tetratricopeptide (TPR) repeat protein
MRIRLNRLLLEAAYPAEIAVSPGGLYPDREIAIPSNEDSQACFEAYSHDAYRRKQLNQLRPGEEVEIVGDRIQVKGQTAVMAINGLVARVIFERNPNRDFFVEESAAIDWMFPHLTPFGIIMKINRAPLTALPEEALAKDHAFWKQYSRRLTGDFIEYDTSVRQVADWIEKTYVRRNFDGFTGDRRFVHDLDAQKCFCKLRTAIAGVYAWRISRACPAEFKPRSNAEFERVWKEANYAFLQAFAFCAYNPELVFRYANLLLEANRLEDAMIVAETCLKLDPFNTQVAGLLSNLRDFKKQQTGTTLQNLEAEVAAHPTNLDALLQLAVANLQLQQTERAAQLLDRAVTEAGAQPRHLLNIAQAFAQIGNWPGLERTLERLVAVDPENPEAWYDLAALRASVGKADQAWPALERALDLNRHRRRQDDKVRDLNETLQQDPRFNALKQDARFQALARPP